MATKKGKALMSYFKNKQGLKIRTYAAEVEKPTAKVFLVHGVRSHFMGDFLAYNIDWYFNYLGEYVTEGAVETAKMERGLVFPSKNDKPRHLEVDHNYTNLDGKDLFEVTPRFKYEGSFVEYLNNMGFNVYALDHQSHGLSESLTGRRCYLERFDDVCYDLLQFISLVKRGKFHDTNQTFNEAELFQSESKEEKDFTTSDLLGANTSAKQEDKWYLMGLSMGGNVVMRAMELYTHKKGPGKTLVDALFCMAGMIDIDFEFDAVRTCLPFLRVLSSLMPSLRMAGASHVTDVLTMYMRSKDPLYYSDRFALKMPLLLLDATRALDRDFNFYPKNLPTLFVHSEHDQTCDVEGPRALMKKYFQEAKHVRLNEIEGGAHVVTSPLKTNITGGLVQKFLHDLTQNDTVGSKTT